VIGTRYDSVANVHCRFGTKLFNHRSVGAEQGRQAPAQSTNVQALHLWWRRYFSPLPATLYHLKTVKTAEQVKASNYNRVDAAQSSDLVS
jgi:hypothetical protein